jgi:nucleoside-diphosphate-sugar epimerase
VRGWIGVVIGLRLDDDAPDAIGQQGRANELGRDHMHAAREEPAPERHEDQILSTAPKDGISNSAMRVFLAGAAGAIGRRLVPLLVRAGHAVTGTTRSAEKATELARAGINPVVLDVFDQHAVIDCFSSAKPEVIIHQLTDLPQQLDQVRISASYAANARIRIEGTRNLLAAARAASARRFIVQSIAFAYAPGREPHPETDPLNLADPMRAVTVKGAADMEQQVLQEEGIAGIVLRYGLLYGPGTWYSAPERKPSLHVDAAAHAAVLAVTRGQPGIYNIAEDDGLVAIEKARAELGFDPHCRLDCDLLR